jgi:hypothetical protein
MTGSRQSERDEVKAQRKKGVSHVHEEEQSHRTPNEYKFKTHAPAVCLRELQKSRGIKADRREEILKNK